MSDAAAEMLAKEMQAIVAADRWKGRDISAAPPEKWSHLRPETQQFWIDTAARILAALPAADARAEALKEAADRIRRIMADEPLADVVTERAAAICEALITEKQQ